MRCRTVVLRSGYRQGRSVAPGVLFMHEDISRQELASRVGGEPWYSGVWRRLAQFFT